jgi:site-specific DNA recombinase
MRIAFYARVSTERQQHAQTIEQQIAQLQAYVAAQEGWTVSDEHIFRDDGYSGAKLDRPGLDAVRDQAARAAFDVVLITAPDRLARTSTWWRRSEGRLPSMSGRSLRTGCDAGG